jgi:hypothetical protein
MQRLAKLITQLGLALTLSPALAQVPDQEMARCAAIKDASARLSCLDALAAAAVARLGGGATAPATVAPPAPKAEESFGKQSMPAPKPSGPDVLESEIEGLVEEWHGRSVFQLKNGQRWRVSDGSSGQVGQRNPRVRIVRNMFGTYFLEFPGINASPKVRRVE